MISLNLPSKDDLIAEIKNNGFAVCHDCFDKNILNKIQKFWIEYFSQTKNFKSSNVHGYSQMIGQENLSSFKRDKKVFLYRHRDYFWNKPLSEITRELSKEIGKYVNKVNDLAIDDGFTFNEKKEAVFNQINCYPDNGYMYKHKDTKAEEIIINSSFPITFKNEHYFEGGLYIEKNEKLFDIDSLLKPTSIVFYNGNLFHEIKKIISDKSIGRIIGYSMKQFFLDKSDPPNYIKFLIQADISIRKKLGIKNVPNQGNVIKKN